MDDCHRVVYTEFSHGNDLPAEQPQLPLPPSQQQLRVQVTRKGRGGKTVTIISGFISTPESLTELLKSLKVHCGSGGTMKENELEIQGNHQSKVSILLANKGYKLKGM
ncbi:MAG: translation initiation factor [Cyanobacteria bacterium REEB444]|nr:translation initiation factor [Cyanobacteria bacterium REEB444]